MAISNSEVTKKSQIYWDLWWLGVAKQYASGSKDPSTKVGAVITVANRLKSAGYNGFKPGADDNPELYWDRDYKLENCIHAEINALNDLPDDAEGATIYVYPYRPCAECATKLAEDWRIRRVITVDYVPERWADSMATAKQILIDSKIGFLEYPITQVN